MTGEQRVLDFIRKTPEPISGQNVRIMLAEHVPPGSVGAYLSTLVDKGLIFKKPIPHTAGKLYWHKPFTPAATMTGAPNRPQAVVLSAPTVPWPMDLPSKRVLPAVAKLAEQNLDRIEAPADKQPAADLPQTSSKPAADPPRVVGVGEKQQAAEAAPPAELLKRKGYEFSLTRGPVTFDLPDDLSWQEIVTIGVMLDAYGQLKRREKKVAA